MRVLSKYNIVVIIMDTVRLDYFRAALADDPELREYGRDYLDAGVCIAPSSWTLPSHASLLTGSYPSTHGAHETERVKDPDISGLKLRVSTMVSELNKLGYSTWLFTANPLITPIFGFDEFKYFRDMTDYYEDLNLRGGIHLGRKARELAEKKFGEDSVKGDSVSATLRSLVRVAGVEGLPTLLRVLWEGTKLTVSHDFRLTKLRLGSGLMLEKGGKKIKKAILSTSFTEPFFVLVNLMEAHEPYFYRDHYACEYNFKTLPASFPGENLLKRWKQSYTLAVKRSARNAFEIADWFKSHYRRNTLIVLTSDHGQAFLEHGYLGHGTVLYDELVKVPFLVSSTDAIGEPRVGGYASLVNFKRFALSASAENPDFSLIFSKEVRAETFGTHLHPPKTPFDLGKYKALNRPQTRVFNWA